MIVINTVILFLCELFLLIHLSSAQTQCSTYTPIDDASRNVNAVGSNGCDTMFIGGPTWVRFTGASGTQMPTSPTNPNQCGTQVTGWYSGSMPSVSQTLSGRVCFSFDGDTCKWSNTISVTNCGSFYVYELTMPPVCSARYCAETSITSTTYFPTTTFTTTMVAPQCSNYTTVDDPTRSPNYNVTSSKQCDQTFLSSGSKWVRFEGEGGTQIPTSPVGVNKCNTDATGWYEGAMPNSLYETTSGRVCFEWQSKPCNWNTNIEVTNCGSYYVYKLARPTSCSLRYCTDTPIIQTTTPIVMSNPQCYNYTTINDPTRNVNQGQGSQADVNYFTSGPQWVRFEGAGGTQIPTSAVPSNQCGTYASGWYSGAMPDGQGSTTSGAVCYTWNNNDCSYSNQIQVTNCGSYFVYELRPPPVSGLRYCTDTPIVQTTTPVMMSSYQCNNYTTINDPTRNENQGLGSQADQSYFRSGPLWVRFEGAGGTEMPTAPVAINHCTTSAPGWYSGVMPSTPDTTNSGTACFKWNQGDCAYSNPIQVTNCGSYYVYYLSAPTTGGMRYCTTTTTTINPAKKSTTVLSSISNFFQNLWKKITG